MNRAIETALSSWWDLQQALMSTTDEAYVEALLEAEKKGQGRKHFIKRIWHRRNKLRSQREWEELHGKGK